MKRVGIIRGGEGENYDFSLVKGGNLISCIFENLGDKYKVLDILVDKEGVWHIGGVPIIPSDLIHQVDVVWNAAHHGISSILDQLSIPRISTSVFSSILEDNHEKLALHLKSLNVKMPRKIVFPVYQIDFDGDVEKYVIKKAKEVHQKFGAPWVVKTYTEDKSMGVHVANTFPELVRALEDGVHHRKSILVEEFISDKSVSVHSVAGFRGDDVYVFPPNNLSKDNKEKLISLMKDLHAHLGAEHYLKADFIIHPRRGILITNISFSPDLTNNSHLAENCESVGAKMHHIVEHILERVL